MSNLLYDEDEEDDNEPFDTDYPDELNN